MIEDENKNKLNESNNAGVVEIIDSRVTAKNIIGSLSVQSMITQEDILEILSSNLKENMTESMKSAMPKIAEDARKEILDRILSKGFLESIWVIYLTNHILPLYGKYGQGENAKVALIGRGLGQIDARCLDGISVKNVIKFAADDEGSYLNLVPITVVNAVAPAAEIYFLEALSGRLSDLIKAMGWCLENKINIVAFLEPLPDMCNDGSCPICLACQKLISSGNILVISSDLGCPKPTIDGIIPIRGVIFRNQEMELLNLTSRFSAKLLALAGIHTCALNAFLVSNVRPMFISNDTELSGEGIAVANVAGIIALMVSFMIRGTKAIIPKDIEDCLKKSAIPIPLKSEDGEYTGYNKYYGLLEPNKLL